MRRRTSIPPAETVEARYANYFEIGHNRYEFVLDFSQCSPNGDSNQVLTRVVLGPVFAKSLVQLLEESLDAYERTFGAIAMDE